MLEEVLELTAGKWAFLGLGALIVAAGPGKKIVRGVLKEAVKVGMNVSDTAREFVAEVKEQGGDLIAEVQSERKEALTEKNHSGGKSHSEKKAKKAAEA